MNEQDYHYKHQLEMDYRLDQSASLTNVIVPDGHHMRQYQPPDKTAFYASCPQ